MESEPNEDDMQFIAPARHGAIKKECDRGEVEEVERTDRDVK